MVKYPCMRITLSPVHQSLLNRMLETLNHNIDMADLVMQLVESMPFSQSTQRTLSKIVPLDPQTVLKYALKKNHIHGRLPYLSLSQQHIDIRSLDIQKYTSNPYYQTIQTNRLEAAGWVFRMEPYQPFELFICNDVSVHLPMFQEVSHLGYFHHPFFYLSVSQHDVNWMSVTPNEMETMQPAIDEAHGRVIVYGLGLGYYPFMIAQKDTVQSIVIIERDAALIHLFNNHLLPQFSHREKITIIQDDAFHFTHSHLDQFAFDYAFVDLWHTADDGLPLYLQMKQLVAPLHQVRFVYWLESSLLSLLRRITLTVVSEVRDGMMEQSFQQALTYSDELINATYAAYRHLHITSIEQINALCEQNQLHELSLQLPLPKQASPH